jgi:protein-S-isoprenylcysteine O-methyltransferase Ste14
MSSRFWSTVTSLLVGFAFLSLWFWLLPQWLGLKVDLGGASAVRLIAAVPAILGFAVALRCIWDFGATGHGTPAPVLPPSNLVVVGFYRYVRNPMYVGFFTGWAGLWIIFGRANVYAIVTALLVIAGIHLFVIFYEEPTLQKKFGEDYRLYCNNVNRWLPRPRAWHPRIVAGGLARH